MSRPNPVSLVLPINIAEEPQSKRHVETNPKSFHSEIEHISRRLSTVVVVKRGPKVALLSAAVPPKARCVPRASSQDIVMLFPPLSRLFRSIQPNRSSIITPFRENRGS